jgi:predicted methyltransferase
MTVLRSLPPLAALGAALLLSACVVSESSGGSAAAEADAAAEGATAASATESGGADALAAAVAGDWRDPDFVARDRFRHPAETLAFFGIEPGDTVIEITPGGGWYAEILAPYLRDGGSYVAAVWDDAIPDQPAYRYRLNESLRGKFSGAPDVYGAPQVRVFDPAKPLFGHRHRPMRC